MARFKLTKGELKKQRDALKQFERYLPTLQLKKQQLQMEILYQHNLREEKRLSLEKKMHAAESWAGLLREAPQDLKGWIAPQEIRTGTKNVAGVDIPVFEKAIFSDLQYDLFSVPAWVDHALEALRGLVALEQERLIIEKGIAVLRQELRITTQRVNLFEKVKIPETKEAIRLIKIYIGDQQANAVGRSKIAKSKIEAYELAGAGP